MDNIPNQSIQNIDDINTISIQDIDKRIDDKINQSIQNIDSINTLSIQDIDDRIAESLADGDIKDAIAKLTEGISNSYAAAMGQFNGLLEELQDLKSQLQELKSVPPAAVPSSQSPINDPSSATNNYQLPVEETGEDSDLIDSISTNDLLPMTFDKNQIDYVQKQLRKNNIKKTAAQIREAFIDLNFDGTNYNQVRDKVIEVLSHE